MGAEVAGTPPLLSGGHTLTSPGDAKCRYMSAARRGLYTRMSYQRAGFPHSVVPESTHAF